MCPRLGRETERERKREKAGKSLCIKTGHTKDDNGLHKHHLELFTWH